MALTVGSGPFGPTPGGEFNFAYETPGRTLYLEDSPRRVRVVVGGETVARSSRAKLLHETGLMPVYYLPEDDVRTDLLEETDHHTHCPFKGEASYHSIRVGDQVRENAVWSYPGPTPPHTPSLAGYMAFYWNAVDEWWEEDERVGVHPRDPYHRCDVLRSDRHVVVRAGEQVIAESASPVVLFETGLIPRFYLPERDVRLELLERSDTQTECPYKGTTSRYYSFRPDDGEPQSDIAWVYDVPHAEVQGIEGLVAFYSEKVEVEVDGERW